MNYYNHLLFSGIKGRKNTSEKAKCKRVKLIYIYYSLKTVFFWCNNWTWSFASIFNNLLTNTSRYLISSVRSSLDTILEVFCNWLRIKVCFQGIGIFDTINCFCWFLFWSKGNIFYRIPSTYFAQKLRKCVDIASCITDGI